MPHDELKLESRFNQLEQTVEQLIRQMEAASRSLREAGTPPDSQIQQSLRDLSDRWGALEHQAYDRRGENGDDAAPCLTLSELQSHLERRANRDAAAGILDRLARICFVDGSAAEDLEAVRREVDDLTEQLDGADGHVIAKAICDGTHPAVALLWIIEDGPSLADDQWLKLQSQIEESYGATLAAASARGRLIVSESAAGGPPGGCQVPSSRSLHVDPAHGATAGAGGVSDVLPKDSGHATSRSETADQTKQTGPQDDADSIFDEAVPQATNGPALLRNRSLQLDEACVQSGRAATLPRAGGEVNRRIARNYTTSQGLVYEAAQRARTAGDRDRPRHLAELATELVAEGQFSLAWHLTGCLETHPVENVIALPQPVVRSLALSRHVAFAQGQLAELLEEDFRTIQDRADFDLEGPAAQALRFLVRAAALRPAVVAPGTRAAALLRTYPQAPGCTELQNYCLRLAAVGERTRGLSPLTFQPSAEHSRQDRIERLRRDAEQWRQQLLDRAVEYVPAKPLFLHNHWSVRSGSVRRNPEAIRDWQQWQQTLRLVDGLLSPVVDGQERERHALICELSRLDRLVRTRSTDEEGGRSWNQDQAVPSQRTMNEALREAMSFAEQWLTLTGPATTRSGPVLSPEAAELRDEVELRHDAVLAELQAVRERTQSPFVRAGVACLTQSIREFRKMVTPCEEIAEGELPARHILHGELLRIGPVSMSDTWEPQCESSELSRHIVRHLTEPRPDWPTAFTVACEMRDQTRADRILELGVLTPDEQSVCQDVRSAMFPPTRSTLLELIAQCESLLEPHREGGHSPARQPTSTQRRLAALSDALQTSDPDLDLIRQELSDLFEELSSTPSGNMCGVDSEHVSTADGRNREADESSVGIFDD